MTPHPHAPALHALIDGKTVHLRDKRIAEHSWSPVTLNDVIGRTWLLDPDTYELRLKPATLRYRVARMKSGTTSWVYTVMFDEAATHIANDACFVRWLTDWQEVEA